MEVTKYVQQIRVFDGTIDNVSGEVNHFLYTKNVVPTTILQSVIPSNTAAFDTFIITILYTIKITENEQLKPATGTS